MNQTNKKMPRGVKAIVIVSIINIVITGLSIIGIFFLLSEQGMTIAAETAGQIVGYTIMHAIFPIITIILAKGATHKNAMIIVLILSSLTGVLGFLLGVVGLIFYFTDSKRKQYFETSIPSQSRYDLGIVEKEDKEVPSSVSFK